MRRFRRPDGVLVERLPATRRIMPFLMRKRNEAMIWFEQDVEVDRALQFVERQTREHGTAVTFFSLVIHAIARTLDEYPKLNRYVVGRRLYRRTDIAISFSGKESFDENAPLYVRKEIFDPSRPVAETAEKVSSRIRDGQARKPTSSDREIDVLLRLPRPLVDLAVQGQRFLDYFNLLPARMIRNDPLYASVFVANLGSVGISGAYHHLYEYGTIPVFLVVGAYRKAPVVTEDDRVEARRVATFKYTFDERIQDGFYCARAVARLKELLENPESFLS